MSSSERNINCLIHDCPCGTKTWKKTILMHVNSLINFIRQHAYIYIYIYIYIRSRIQMQSQNTLLMSLRQSVRCRAVRAVFRLTRSWGPRNLLEMATSILSRAITSTLKQCILCTTQKGSLARNNFRLLSTGKS